MRAICRAATIRRPCRSWQIFELRQTLPRSPAPPLLDWEQDAPLIAADINKAAGCEVRALPYLHWWTFMAWFNSIGDGQLATLLRVRSKLRHGQKLQPWEQDYYRKTKPWLTCAPA